MKEEFRYQQEIATRAGHSYAGWGDEVALRMAREEGRHKENGVVPGTTMGPPLRKPSKG